MSATRTNMNASLQEIVPNRNFHSANATSAETNKRRGEVVQNIRGLMSELGLEIGDRLPGERQMAADFSVSRGKIREALQFLATMGHLEVRHGGGSYLLTMPEEMGQSQNSWSRWIKQNRGRVLEILEVRAGAEAFAAELASRRARPEDLERLMNALQSMKALEYKPDVTAFVQGDLAFHDALVRSAGNETLRNLLSTLGEELVVERAAVVGIEGRMAISYTEHLEIYEAVASGDGPRAAASVRQHLESIKQDILSGILDEGDPSQLRSAGSVKNEVAELKAVQKTKPVTERK